MKAAKKKATKKVSQSAAGSHKEIGNFILVARQALGKSQREYAAMIGVLAPQLHHAENGRWRYPYAVVRNLPLAQRKLAQEILAKYQREDCGL